MDYLVIGSNGFAQVGRPDFFEKNKVEMKVLLEYLQMNCPIPDEFAHMCFYKAKWFSHDFGNYSEIVLMYDDRILNQWDENDPDKFNRFWDWFNEVEGADLETESLNQVLKNQYTESKSAKVINTNSKNPYWKSLLMKYPLLLALSRGC